MAQYKVPQDVEADDKLIGPFSFRQFVYLLVAGGLIALAVGLFQLFPLLAIIPVPFVIFFCVLALPLKKDQPMETYLAAVVSYYLKPHNRVWTPGQRNSTIIVAAPKVEEDDGKARAISGDEVTHRLSFLADIVDTQGYSIRDSVSAANKVQEDLVAEANMTNDIFETGHFDRLESTIAKDEIERHEEVMKEMRQAIANNNQLVAEPEVPQLQGVEAQSEKPQPPLQTEPAITKNKVERNVVKSSIMELANNADFSVATIEKEANRIKKKEDGEIYISLH